MAYTNKNIQSAYNRSKSKYKKINAYTQGAFDRLQQYETDTKNNLQDAYKQMQTALDNALSLQKNKNAYEQGNVRNAYYSNIGNINAKAKPMENAYGTRNESLVSQGLRGSGYEEVLKSQGFMEKQTQLANASNQLQGQIAQLEMAYQQAIVDNNQKTAQLALDKMRELQQLQKEVLDQIAMIEGNAYDMDYNERVK